MTVRLLDLRLPLEHKPDAILAAAAANLGVARDDIQHYEVRREAVDARRKSAIHLVYSLDLGLRDGVAPKPAPGVKTAEARDLEWSPPPPGGERLGQRPVVVGTGPAGLFAGLALARGGYRPLLIERGKPVDERAADVGRFWSEGRLEPESNAQFGEGGAGTFSDGKLNSLINDPRCGQVLREFVAAGAPPSLLVGSRPHLGSDQLQRILAVMRATLLGLGADYRFSCRLEGVEVAGGSLRSIVLADGERLPCVAAVLALGHSADDTIASLVGSGLVATRKPLAIGLRIEHPQALIDAAQYGAKAGHPRLGPAEYKLAWHGPGGRSAYSFCMCPGGEVIAASSRPGCLVTNGMSLAAREARNANAAILVNVGPEDFPGDSVLAGFEFQRIWEKAAFLLGGSEYRAPAQLLGDFRAGRASSRFGLVEPSYRPGIRPADLSLVLPPFVSSTIAAALPEFGRRLRGFDRDDAVLTGVETRSSSPIRLLRGDDCQSSIGGLYPAGEGAGYAGGIMSAAVDGLRVAESIMRRFAPPD